MIAIRTYRLRLLFYSLINVDIHNWTFGNEKFSGFFFRKRLALSRSDMSIEIWNFSFPNCPILERSIPGHASEGSIEALAWAKPAPNVRTILLHLLSSKSRRINFSFCLSDMTFFRKPYFFTLQENLFFVLLS